MNTIYTLRTGDTITVRSGATAEVMIPSEDGRWILVKYLRSKELQLVGTTDLVEEYDIEAAFQTAN